MIYIKKTTSISPLNFFTTLPLTFFLLLLFSCNQAKKLPNDSPEKSVIQSKSNSEGKDIFKNGYNINEPTFDVLFQVNELENNEYNLMATIILDKGSYIISPFSTDSTYGHFYFNVEKSDYLVTDNQLIETPNSVEEFDPIIEAPVRFVRVNTAYRQKLKLTKEEDFEVTGLVEFLLEPICVPYDVEFKISYKNGTMKVEKTKTVISSEYKM